VVGGCGLARALFRAIKISRKRAAHSGLSFLPRDDLLCFWRDSSVRGMPVLSFRILSRFHSERFSSANCGTFLPRLDAAIFSRCSVVNGANFQPLLRRANCSGDHLYPRGEPHTLNRLKSLFSHSWLTQNCSRSTRFRFPPLPLFRK